jgi:hypothetical protein
MQPAAYNVALMIIWPQLGFAKLFSPTQIKPRLFLNALQVRTFLLQNTMAVPHPIPRSSISAITV